MLKSLKEWLKKPDDLYKSISELPMLNWIDMRSKGDFRYLFKVYKNDITQSEFELLEKTYYSIIDEFWDRFGQAKEFELTNKKKLKLHQINIHIAKTGDRKALGEKKILEKDIYKEIDNAISDIDARKVMQKEFAEVSTKYQSMSIITETVLDFYIKRELLIK